jgi:hypothetical protein
MSKLIGTWRAIGTTDEVHACEHCGETSLKVAIRMLCVGADEECLGEMCVGSTCASRMSGMRVSDILAEAKRANQMIYKDKFAAWNEWNHRKSDTITALCELHFRGKSVRPRVWCEYQETPEFLAKYSAWLDKNPEPIRPVAPR